MKHCERCGHWWYDDDICRCEPYQVYYPDYYGEEKETVYGFSHEDIVEKIAREINCDEHNYDVDIFEDPIKVTDKNGVEKSFNCVATVSVDYSVRESS